ncbi:MAG TPA: glycerol acyltransferase, partial [Gammaproteobacteria bacterium]|nr:glycerol acyltransferase [Gammaproteobacteria bacterium]
NLLVMTAQGRFADVRSRPAGLRNGVAHLLHAQSGRIAVPVALEYVFWNERLPEALVAFGEPQRAVPGESTAATTQRLDAALVRTQDALRADAVRRDPERFEAILGGRRRDVGGIYGAFRRISGPFRRTRSEPGSPASRS